MVIIAGEVRYGAIVSGTSTLPPSVRAVPRAEIGEAHETLESTPSNSLMLRECLYQRLAKQLSLDKYRLFSFLIA
jgi:hypothetical protein